MPSAIISSISSGIGLALAHELTSEGWSITGTTRNRDRNFGADKSWRLIECDFGSQNSIDLAAGELQAIGEKWDALVICTGTMNPIGGFESTDISDWVEAVNVNFVNQLYFLRQVLSMRKKGEGFTSKCVFFAGGGTNSAPVGFSAYTLSKIALIKAAELLDAELPDVAFTALGPGWVRTAIHDETLSARDAPPQAVTETRRRLTENDFVDMNDVVKALTWLLAQSKAVVGGRNFSVAGDPIHHPDFGSILEGNPNLFKLRRMGNDAKGILR